MIQFLSTSAHLNFVQTTIYSCRNKLQIKLEYEIMVFKLMSFG